MKSFGQTQVNRLDYLAINYNLTSYLCFHLSLVCDNTHVYEYWILNNDKVNACRWLLGLIELSLGLGGDAGCNGGAGRYFLPGKCSTRGVPGRCQGILLRCVSATLALHMVIIGSTWIIIVWYFLPGDCSARRWGEVAYCITNRPKLRDSSAFFSLLCRQMWLDCLFRNKSGLCRVTA